MADSKPPTSLTNPTYEVPSVHLATPASMQHLRTLLERKSIVLFTPAVPTIDALEGIKSEQSIATDPFEPLGRALCKYHSHITHVPFVPKVGFTDTHLEWTRRAGAVIVVNAKVPHAPKAAVEASLANQARFAAAVSNALRDEQRLAVAPLTALYCGSGEPESLEGFQIVLRCPTYEASDLVKVADLLFEGTMH